MQSLDRGFRMLRKGGECNTQLRQPAANAPRRVAAAAVKKAESEGGRSRKRSQPVDKKGFGRQQTQDAALKELDTEQQPSNYVPRTEYQMYKDADFRPQRYIGPVEVATVPGKGRGLVTTEDVSGGDLLILSPAIAFLEGDWQQAPDPEDLHVAMLESGLTPAQRRVLDQLLLPDQAAAAAPATLTTLDVKFWASRGRQDASAPQVSSGRLLNILQSCACVDGQQDGAAMTLRHQKPNGYVGLWAEFALLNHSCAPNTSILVVKDRMLVHAVNDLEAGDELTRSYLPAAASTAPAPQRQAALDEAGWGDWRCGCYRCQLEARVSPELQEVLQGAYTWYSEEAVARFSESNVKEDLGMLTELLEEARLVVQEVEEAVAAEPGLTELDRVWLRAAAYDSYDMLLMCDEYVNKEKAASENLLSCLELLGFLAPGSETHVMVAQKYEMLMKQKTEIVAAMVQKSPSSARDPRMRQQFKVLERQEQLAQEYFLSAVIARYGLITSDMLAALSEAIIMFQEAQEQMSIMQHEGRDEDVHTYNINGVEVSVIDSIDLSKDGSGEGGSAGKFTVLPAMSNAGDAEDGEVVDGVSVTTDMEALDAAAAELQANWAGEAAAHVGEDAASEPRSAAQPQPAAGAVMGPAAVESAAEAAGEEDGFLDLDGLDSEEALIAALERRRGPSGSPALRS